MKSGDIIWIVGKHLGIPSTWDIQGVFSTEKKAVEACTKDNYFVGPLEVDKNLPDDSIEWKGAYFPSEGKRKD